MKKLQPLEGLIKSFYATTGEGATSTRLKAEYDSVVAVGLNVAPVVWSTICARRFTEAKAEKQYDECANVLDRGVNELLPKSKFPAGV